MKRSPKLQRRTANLSEAFRQRLNAYALAAGAAGVSLLPLASPAEAAVQYTAENIVIKRQSTVVLDFDLGLAPPFYLRNTVGSATETGGHFRYSLLDVRFVGSHTAGVEVGIGGAAALTKGSRIGSSKQFQGCTFLSSCIPDQGVPMVFFTSGRGPGGNWVNVTDKYLGLKFTLGDGTHYAWARFSVQVTSAGLGRKNIVARFTGYAYEDVPDTPILAGDMGVATKSSEHSRALLRTPLRVEPALPQPASLGMLALGAQGIPAWRKEMMAQLYSS
jgi:hypothetical protein